MLLRLLILLGRENNQCGETRVKKKEVVTVRYKEINGPVEDMVSSGMGIGSFLDVMVLRILGVELKILELLGSDRPMLLLWAPKGLTHSKDS